jgi:hypothetical protein
MPKLEHLLNEHMFLGPRLNQMTQYDRKHKVMAQGICGLVLHRHGIVGALWYFTGHKKRVRIVQSVYRIVYMSGAHCNPMGQSVFYTFPSVASFGLHVFLAWNIGLGVWQSNAQLNTTEGDRRWPTHVLCCTHWSIGQLYSNHRHLLHITIWFTPSRSDSPHHGMIHQSHFMIYLRIR